MEQKKKKKESHLLRVKKLQHERKHKRLIVREIRGQDETGEFYAGNASGFKCH